MSLVKCKIYNINNNNKHYSDIMYNFIIIKINQLIFNEVITKKKYIHKNSIAWWRNLLTFLLTTVLINVLASFLLQNNDFK